MRNLAIAGAGVSVYLRAIDGSRSVAQPGSASGLGPEGREFESLHSDHRLPVRGQDLQVSPKIFQENYRQRNGQRISCHRESTAVMEMKMRSEEGAPYLGGIPSRTASQVTCRRHLAMELSASNAAPEPLIFLYFDDNRVINLGLVSNRTAERVGSDHATNRKRTERISRAASQRGAE